MTSQIIITPIGGITWAVTQDDVYLGNIEAGTLDEDGQWQGGADDVEAAARKAFQFPTDAAVEVE